MCEATIREMQVKENRWGAWRTGWKHPDHVQPEEVLGEALGVSCALGSRSISIFAAFKPCLERLASD